MNPNIRDVLERSLLPLSVKFGGPEGVVSDSMESFLDEIDTTGQKFQSFSNVFRTPDGNEVITYDQRTGDPVSRYADDVWRELRYGGDIIIAFDANSKTSGIDYSHPHHIHLYIFRKLLTYYQVPAKNPYALVKSFNTTKSMFNAATCLCEIFYENGYMINTNESFKAINTFGAEFIRRQTICWIKKQVPYSKIQKLIKATIIWCNLSHLNALPAEYTANFTASQYIDNNEFQGVVNQYLRQNSGQWKCIEYGDLVRLMQTANIYIENYSRDLIYLIHKYEESRTVQECAGHAKPRYEIWTSHGVTKQIGQEVLKYKLADDPRTKQPWLKLDVLTFSRDDWGGKTEMLAKTPIIAEWQALTDAAIYMVISWTAMRLNEFVNLRIDDLSIDGQQYQYAHEAISKVSAGKTFDLVRTITKTEDSLGGRSKKVPLPQIGALAFAVLVELYRFARNINNNRYLLPAGLLQGHGGPGGKVVTSKKQGPVSSGQVRRSIAQFCELAGTGPYHTHQLRKTLATLLISHDPGALQLVQDLLCHRDISMTKRYLMSIPAVAEDIKEYMESANKDKLIDWLSDAVDGKVAGQAGDRTLDAIAKNREFFQGDLLPVTISTLVESVCPSHIIIRTPAAWCMRFPSVVPKAAPCLIAEADCDTNAIYPNPSRCRPWLCGSAGHTTKDSSRAKQALRWAEKKSSDATVSLKRRDEYSVQMNYWRQVVAQLENGRPDIVALGVGEMILRENAAGWS